MSRADATKEHMGLTSWTDAPLGKIQKFDVVVAKNYLSEDELALRERRARSRVTRKPRRSSTARGFLRFGGRLFSPGRCA